jgi:hypothetical protein
LICKKDLPCRQQGTEQRQQQQQQQQQLGLFLLSSDFERAARDVCDRRVDEKHRAWEGFDVQKMNIELAK